MPKGKTEQNTVVLVMDQLDEDVKLITSLLQKSGFHVVQSADEAEVLDLCRTAEDAIQLIVADAGTPGIEISELLEHVQAANSRVRALVISGKKEPPLTRNASNVWGYLSRPFRRAQFLGSVLDAAKGPLVRTA
jgi:CheY-like chemotaxis protein